MLGFTIPELYGNQDGVISGCFCPCLLSGELPAPSTFACGCVVNGIATSIVLLLHVCTMLKV